MDQKIKKKNKTSMITIGITTFTLLVLIGTASFAFFSSSVNSSGNIVATMHTASGSYVFSVNKSSDLSFSLGLNNMSSSSVSTTTPAVSKSVNITTNLLSGSTQESTVCTYDLQWEWTSSDMYTAKDSGATKEFTITINKNGKAVVAEKDFADFTRSNKVITLYHGTTTSTKVNGWQDDYEINIKMYNLSMNQTNIAGKNYSGKVNVVNVSCTVNSANVTIASAKDSGGTNVTVTPKVVSDYEAQNYKNSLIASNNTNLTTSQIQDATVINLTAGTHSGAVTTSIDVSKFAHEGDMVLLYHYNGSTWESLGNYVVDANGRISASITNFSPFMIIPRKSYDVPKEYQRVEYIQNSGTQYIDTGWHNDFDINTEIKLVYKPTVLGYRYALISSYSTSNHLSYEINAANQSRLYANNSDIHMNSGVTSSNFNIDVISWNNKSYTQTLNGVSYSSTSNSLTGKSAGSAYLFVDNAKRFSTFNHALQIQYVSIKENNVLVRSFVPCYRKSDSVIGMFDVVTNAFYTNAGTGSFTKGSNVY